MSAYYTCRYCGDAFNFDDNHNSQPSWLDFLNIVKKETPWWVRLIPGFRRYTERVGSQSSDLVTKWVCENGHLGTKRKEDYHFPSRKNSQVCYCGKRISKHGMLTIHEGEM